MMIETFNLSKIFYDSSRGEVKAVDGVSFDCKLGEIVALLGVNGAGKTTTMRLLSTVLDPSGGTAKVCGYDIRKNPEDVRKNLGFLSGDTGLYPRLKAREIITYFGRLYDMTKSNIKSRIEELSSLLGMNEFLDTKIDSLSTGMKQKLSIARSIVHNPPVMIFDEATVGLDILTARNIVDFIHQCKKDNKAVLFSTHIMREAERIADRIIIIHNGKLMAQGTLADLQAMSNKTELEDVFIELIEEQDKQEDKGSKNQEF